jgi:Predicted AAA-ATPase
MIKIPYGLADFKSLRNEDYFYVDRTSFIEQIEVHASRYVLFVRPRRFGKSLFISVLENYYGLHQKANFESLFGNLYIGQNPTPLANKFMIMRFDFSGIETQDLSRTNGAFLLKVKDGIHGFLGKYPDFLSLEEAQYIKNQVGPAEVMTAFFGIYKQRAEPAPVYVLIDEYDQFTNELLTFHFSEFQHIVSENGYVRKFYEVLKTEAGLGNIGRIFLTGVAPVTVDSLTSGFNITTDISLHPFFHNMTGFTEAEVSHLLQEIGVKEAQLPQLLDDLRYWYDGYCFNADVEQRLYNPDMVLYFVSYYQSIRRYPKKMLTANVASDYQKIANVFRLGNDEVTALSSLNELVVNGEIKGYITDRFNIKLGFGITEILSMLFYMGLTTIKEVVGNRYTFQMPNYVIKSLYYDYFVALQLGKDYGTLKYQIQDALENLVFKGKIEEFVGFVEQALKKHSNRDNVGFNEKHLKSLVIGLLFPYENYLIRSEMEEEKRFVDIFLERIPQVYIKHEILIELKYIKKENGDKWVDKDGNLVSPSRLLRDVPSVQGSKIKTRKKNQDALLPNPPVKSLLDKVSDEGLTQLGAYMTSPRFQRPNLLGFCLVFVNTECKRILPYSLK